MINISEKRELENGDSYYLVEQIYDKSNGEIKSTSNSAFKIKMKSLRIPFSGVTFLLTKEGEYIGHISASLFEDNTAALVMSGIRDILLPDGLEKYHELINNHDAAILVNEKYRGQNKSKELIYLMLCYLCEKGIENVEVDGISNDIAWKTYLGTGAVQISEKQALYCDISSILNSDIFNSLTTGKKMQD